MDIEDIINVQQLLIDNMNLSERVKELERELLLLKTDQREGKQLIVHEYDEDLQGKTVWLWINDTDLSTRFIANWGDDEGRWFFFDREAEFFEIYNVNPTHYEII